MKNIEINYEMIGYFDYELYKYLKSDIDTNYCSIDRDVVFPGLEDYFKKLNDSLLKLVPNLKNLKSKIKINNVKLIFDIEGLGELDIYDIKKKNYSLYKWIYLVYLLTNYFYNENGSIKLTNSEYIPITLKDKIQIYFSNIEFTFINNEILEL